MSLLSSTGLKLNEYAAATMVYFERHKLIEIAKARSVYQGHHGFLL